MEDYRDRVRDRRAFEDVPELLKTRDVAKSYYDVVRDQFGAAGIVVAETIAAELAASIDDIILAKRKVDWTEDVDVQNQMKIAVEDEFFALKKTQGIVIDFNTIDRLLDRIIDVARDAFGEDTVDRNTKRSPLEWRR